ncbi:MAG: hypothetical protein ABIO70_28160 [Pseudomonadota bacterium]
MSPAPRTWDATVFEAAVEGINVLADTHLHVVIDVPGRLDAALLRRALQAVSRDVPELGAVLERRISGPRWVAQADPSWEILERCGVGESEAAIEEADLYALPFEPYGALPLRARLLHLAERDRLLLRVSHLLADGGGCKNLCYRLAAACAAIAAGRPPPRWPNPRPNPLLRLLRSLRLRALPWSLLDLLDDLLVNRLLRPACPPFEVGLRGEARCARLHLPTARVAHLRARRRAPRPTVNDLMLAAFSRALAAVEPAGSGARAVQVIATSDLRLLEGGADDVCNYSALRPFDLGRLPLPAPEEHLARVMRATSLWKRGRPGLLASIIAIGTASLLPRSLAARLVHGLLGGMVRLQGRGVALTNIGPIDAARLDFGGGPCLAAHVKAPPARPPMLIAAVTGCAGALDLTVAYTVPGHPEEAVAALLAATEQELEALC